MKISTPLTNYINLLRNDIGDIAFENGVIEIYRMLQCEKVEVLDEEDIKFVSGYLSLAIENPREDIKALANMTLQKIKPSNKYWGPSGAFPLPPPPPRSTSAPPALRPAAFNQRHMSSPPNLSGGQGLWAIPTRRRLMAMQEESGNNSHGPPLCYCIIL